DMGYTLRFELRKDVVNKSGENPISLILSVSQKRKRIAIDETVHVLNWDPALQRARYVGRKEAKKLDVGFNLSNLRLANDIADLNETLDKIEALVKQVAKKFEFEKIPYSVQMLAEAYIEAVTPRTKVDEPTRFIFDYIDKYIQENEPSRAKGSLAVYKQLKMHLEAYIAHYRINVKFEDIDLAFFRSFENFLIKHRAINNVTIAKQLSTLKTFIGYAQSDGIQVSDSFRKYKIR